MKGYIKLHREIADHWLWNEKPFSKGQAWVDILMMVNHETNKFVFGKQLVEVERGSCITSELKLSDRWGWSRHKVDDFLKLLQNDKMLGLKKDNKKTILEVCNYSHFQSKEEQEGQQKDNKRTSKGHQKDTNKNDKECKEVYIEFFENVWSLYPNKKGKDKVAKAQIKKLQIIGIEELTRCVNRYKQTKEEWKAWQQGSTFFNGGYVDYLDINFEDKPKEQTWGWS